MDAHSNGQDAVQFGKLPYRVVTSGMLGRLKRSELAVYVVIAAHSNGDDFTSRPSVATIFAEANVSERTAQRAVRGLEGYGLIVVRLGGGSATNTYELTTDPRHLGDTPVAAADPRHSCDTPPPSKSAVTPVIAVTPKQKNRERTEQAEPASPTAAAGGGDRGEKGDNRNGGYEGKNRHDPAVDARRGALAAAGIGNPKREQLASDPYLTPAIIRAKAAWCHEHRKRTGVLILELEAIAGQVLAKEAEQSDFDRRWEAIGRRNAAEAQRGRARKALFARLSDDGKVLAYYMDQSLPSRFEDRFEQITANRLAADWTRKRYEKATEEFDRAKFPEAYEEAVG